MPRERNIRDEVEQEAVLRAAWKEWMQKRVEEIHRRVTVHDILSRHGVKLRYMDGSEQMSCPFHGKDAHFSAKVYPEDARGPSHVWCFACNERWDSIGLWKKFDGRDDVKFGALLREIETAYGITPPEVPNGVTGQGVNEENQEFQGHLDALETCENILKLNRDAFDMRGFLTLGIVLDRLRKQVEERALSPSEVERHLQQLKDKIALKEGVCRDV